jgi:chromosome segregation ATPase
MEPHEHLEELEGKLRKAIEIFRRSQAEKRALSHDIDKLRLEVKEHLKLIDALEQQLVDLRREREDVRFRIEKVVLQIDALSSSHSEG